MASPYSQIQQVRKPNQTLDTELFGKVVGAKQKNFSKNEALINQTISEISKIDLLRDPDKAYLQERLKKVVNIVQNTDNIDFTSGSAGARLGSFITQAIDGNVKKHAAITAQKRAFDKGVAKKREKNDGSFNQGNYQDALKQSGFYDYMEGNSADDNISQLSYTNYVDVNEKMLKNIKQLKDLFPNKPIEVFDPITGITTKKNVSTLSKAEWQRHIQNSFDDNDKAQMAINGRQAYNYDDTLASSTIKERRDKLELGFDTEISRLKAMKTSSVSDADKKYYQTQIDTQTRNKTASLTTLDTIPKTAGQIGAFLIQEHMSMDMAEAMSRETILSQKIDYKELNEKAKYFKTLQETKNVENNVNNGITTKARPEDLGALDGRKGRDIFKESKEKSANKTRQVFSDAYNNLKKNDKELVKEIDNVEQQIITDFTKKFGRGPEEFELHRLVVDKVEKLLPADMKVDLNKSLIDTEQYFNAEKEAKKKTVDNILTSNSQDFFEQTFDNERQMVMFDKEGNKTTYGKFLRDEGITDKASFDRFLNSDTDKAKLYKANVVLQSLPLGRKTIANTQPSNVIGNIVRKTLGGDFEGTEALKYEYAKTVFGDNIDKIQAKTALQEISAKEIYMGLFQVNPIADRTIRNEGAVNSLLENKEYEKEYDRSLNLSSANIPGMNTLTIDPQVVKGAVTNALHRELMGASENKAFDIKRTVSLMDNGNTITIYQKDMVEKTKIGMDGELSPVQEVEYITEEINKNDLSPTNYPELYRQLEDQEEKSQINFFKQSSFEKENITFYEDTANQAQGLRNLFGNDIAIIKQASKSSADGYIKNTLRTKLAGKQGEKEFYQIVDESIKQIDKFKVGLSTSESGGYSQVEVKMLNKEGTKKDPQYDVLYTIPVEGTSDELNNILHGAPQVMVTRLLIEAGKQLGQNNITLANKFAKNLD